MGFTIHSFRKWFKSHKVHFFSILCALFLWYFIIVDNVLEQVVSIPLQLDNQPEGWILTEGIPSHVRVRLRGKGKHLLSLYFRSRSIKIDLNNEKVDTYFPITLEAVQRGLPEGLSLLPLEVIEPESVMVKLDRFEERRVPVQCELVIVPLSGYTQVGDIEYEPDTTVVSGPASLVEQISAVTTVPRTYRNVLKKLEGEIPLIEPAWKTVRYHEEKIRFSAGIQRIGERIMTEIPVQVVNLPANIKNVRIIPSTLSLTLQGGVNILSQLRKEDIQVTIDYSSRRQGQQYRAAIIVPRDVMFTQVKPQFFEVILER